MLNSKEGLVMFTRRTSAQAVPVCVRVLTAPPILYIKSHCGLNNHPVAIGLCKVFGKMNCGGRGNWLRRESGKGTSFRCFE